MNNYWSQLKLLTAMEVSPIIYVYLTVLHCLFVVGCGAPKVFFELLCIRPNMSAKLVLMQRAYGITNWHKVGNQQN